MSSADASECASEFKFFLPSLSSGSDTSSSIKVEVPLPHVLLPAASAKSLQHQIATKRSKHNRAAEIPEQPSIQEDLQLSNPPACVDSAKIAGQQLVEHQPLSAPNRDLQHLMPAAETLLDGSEHGCGHLQELHLETGTAIALLQQLEEQGVLHQIPRNDQGQLASLGSIRHASGKCSPCIFWFNSSCMKGLSCTYCHFKHKGQKFKRIRPSKKTRQSRRDCEGEEGEEDAEGGICPVLPACYREM